MLPASTIAEAVPNALSGIDIPQLGTKEHGKVRDFYVANGKRVVVTTDRQSAFDVVLGCVPYKGAVLNLLSKFWFEQTKQIVPNHMISIPDPNVLVSHDCQGIPVEMIVRGYISGVTNTSLWRLYEQGERTIYGLKFPDGLKKNQQLPEPVITPTTHAGVGAHDEKLTREEIISRGIVPADLYAQMEKAAIALFKFGGALVKERGLILVDTKYEFGLKDGKLMLIDEIHTPDSSRFWIADSYPDRLASGEEPENFDKEFLRLWFAKQGYRGDGTPPPLSEEIVVELSQRYIAVYEKITGREFEKFSYPIEQRILANLKAAGII